MKPNLRAYKAISTHISGHGTKVF